MKYFSYFLVIMVILWLGARLRPNVVVISDTLALIEAALLFCFVSSVFALLVFGLFMMALPNLVKRDDILVIVILSVFFAVFTNFFSLIVTETIIPDFQIVGLWTSFCIACIATLFTSSISYSAAS